jgi:hypothetical protein
MTAIRFNAAISFGTRLRLQIHISCAAIFGFGAVALD